MAIETALTLRQAEGFFRGLFVLMGIDRTAPDTTLSRRGRSLDLSLRRMPTEEPVHLFIDSTG